MFIPEETREQLRMRLPANDPLRMGLGEPEEVFRQALEAIFDDSIEYARFLLLAQALYAAPIAVFQWSERQHKEELERKLEELRSYYEPSDDPRDYGYDYPSDEG